MIKNGSVAVLVVVFLSTRIRARGSCSGGEEEEKKKKGWGPDDVLACHMAMTNRPAQIRTANESYSIRFQYSCKCKESTSLVLQKAGVFEIVSKR